MGVNATPPRAVLIGPMASGKSSIGRSLANRWGVELRDSDALIVERAGKPITEIFAADGEDAFRAMEHDVIVEQLASFDGVLALGGGAVVHEGTRAALRDHRVVYLTVDERNAGFRLRNDTSRPVLAGGGIAKWREVFVARELWYVECAKVTVDTSTGTTGASATRIIEGLAAAGYEELGDTGGKRPVVTSTRI